MHNGHNPPFDLGIWFWLWNQVLWMCIYMVVDWVELCIWYGFAISLTNANLPTSLSSWICLWPLCGINFLTSDSLSTIRGSYEHLLNGLRKAWKTITHMPNPLLFERWTSSMVNRIMQRPVRRHCWAQKAVGYLPLLQGQTKHLPSSHLNGWCVTLVIILF